MRRCEGGGNERYRGARRGGGGGLFQLASTRWVGERLPSGAGAGRDQLPLWLSCAVRDLRFAPCLNFHIQ